jgi:hypothetical protein
MAATVFVTLEQPHLTQIILFFAHDQNFQVSFNNYVVNFWDKKIIKIIHYERKYILVYLCYI